MSDRDELAEIIATRYHATFPHVTVLDAAIADAILAAGWVKAAPQVDVEISCPVRLMDGRNEIRCWYPAGHEGECR